MSFSSKIIEQAFGLLSQNNSVETSQLEETAGADAGALRELATISTGDSVVISPETLDAADLFYILSHPDLIENSDAQAVQKLREHLGFPNEDPAGTHLEFGLLVNAQGQTIAKTKIVPENADPEGVPIIFAGGLFHHAAVYLNYMAALAKQTGREVLLFDAPGVGGSVYNVPSITREMLNASMPDVIKSEYDASQPIAVMGHSLGTVAVRNLYHNETLVPNPINKFSMVCPPPAASEVAKGYYFSPAYVWDGVKAILGNDGRFTVNEKAFEFLYQMHNEQTDWPWLKEKIKNQTFSAQLGPYSKMMLQISEQSLLDDGELGTDPRLAWVLAQKDNIMKLTEDAKITEYDGVSVVPGADHSFLADDEVNQDFLQYLIDSLADVD